MCCFDHVGVGRQWWVGKEEIKKSLQSFSLEKHGCACVQQHRHRIWQQTGGIFSQGHNHHLSPKISTHMASYKPWKKEKTNLFSLQNRRFNECNLWESHSTQLKSNYANLCPRMTSMCATLTPHNGLLGSYWLTAVRNNITASSKELDSGGHAPKRKKSLHVFFSEARGQKNAGNKAAILGCIA